MPETIRTPDARFANLADYPYAPKYVELPQGRVHVVDEGEGEVVLCLHGEPSWSYLYRKVINGLKDAHRAVAFDFIGFGKSDKYTEQADYTYDLHQHTLLGVIEALGLRDITLIVQDWGGLVGLPTAAAHPDLFKRLVILNTFLPIAERPPSRAFKAWHLSVKRAGRELSIENIMKMALAEQATDDLIKAYTAPFPGPEYKAGAAEWPLMVPTEPNDPLVPVMKEARERLAKWHKPTLVMFSDDDRIIGRADRWFREHIPAAAEQPEIVLEGGGHFLQEKHGDAIAEHVAAFIARTPGGAS